MFYKFSKNSLAYLSAASETNIKSYRLDKNTLTYLSMALVTNKNSFIGF
jgi:hypothetical protein